MRVTTKGQVTIPIEIRERLGIFPNTEVEFGVRGNTATLRKAAPKNGRLGRGEEIVARLRGKGSANLDLTTDEILALMRG
ncbi:MAG TPA: AbrB/MazE/SpoVT family DNA-binding domain-containing protein [Pyrinomonadaceae bacterium]|nr:AbrB/MazE/SpoVT family DNA-binding domain-containing protein [Pyrinomonadaceae bacterium]